MNDRRHPRNGRRRRTNWTWYLGLAAAVLGTVVLVVVVGYRDQMPWRTHRVSINGPGATNEVRLEPLPSTTDPAGARQPG